MGRSSRGEESVAAYESRTAAVRRPRAEPFFPGCGLSAGPGTFLLPPPLPGGEVLSRNSPPAAGSAQLSPAADVGRPASVGLWGRVAMAVDITLLFRASVKTVKTRNKVLGVAVGGGVDGSRDELFRRSPRPKGDFSSRAREVISHIGKLKDFLLEHRKDYINAYSHIMSEYGRMTDTERDQIDQDAQIFMRTCSEAIQQLRAEAHKEIHSQQVKEHRTAVLDFIEDYLKRVCKLYSEQRAIRVKRVVDKKRLSKLEPEPSPKARECASSEKVSETPSKDSEEKPAPEEYPGYFLITDVSPSLSTVARKIV
ncbi:syntaxin-18 isoform X2 [Octodon degus]|uniref:Syntaxin-18 isoform X2 n=1 Tax=Octodon degus TaxID=10160 RepID=A0A6P6D5T8_OCTDE|nr:syntaxin-18 isoform X2 [Octodon degus]